MPSFPLRALSTASLFILLILGLESVASSDPTVGRPIDPTPRWTVEVPLDDPEVQLPDLRTRGFDIYMYDIKTGSAFLVVTAEERADLTRSGFEPVVLEEATTTDGSIAALSDYSDPAESDAAVDRVASEYPSIARRLEYGGLTAEGRVVSLLKVSDNVDQDEAEPRILFVSQHHAREVMTPEVMIDMMDYLTQNYGIDPEVTKWVDNYEIYIIPCHNPDGTDYMFNVNNNWRKNRRDNEDGTYGVDLNRNYDYLWGPEGCNGSSGSTNSDTYRGPAPASEPETQGINGLALEVHPSISLTYHTSGQYVLHPFGCDPNLPDDPDRRTHRDIGSMLAAAIVNDAGNGYYRMGTAPELLYEVDGDSDGWLHAVAGTVGFTIEMNTSFQPDYDSWRDDTVERNREGWKYLLRRLDGGSVTGRVRDACTGLAVEAEVGVSEQLFNHGQEPRLSLPGHGFHHRILTPGEYTWYGQVAGYHRQEWPVEIAFDPVERDLWLVPEGSRGLELRGLAVDDAGGDSDGKLDPGEEADLLLSAVATGEGVTGVTATLATSDPYLVILDGLAALPDLAAGAEGEALDPFRVRALEDAPDGHVASVTVTFAANESLCRDQSGMDLRVTRGFPSCPFEHESLDSDPGWTVSGPPDGWEFGIPQGTGGTGGPAAAHTGDFVYATNLDGNYGTTAGEFVLTTTPFDLQGLRDAELRLRRWLNDEPGYDPVRIETSIDGVAWTEVWRGFGRDTGWEEYRIDLPAEVDDESQVWIRFTLVQDGGGSRSGMYLDDISLCGESALSAGGKVKYESHSVTENDPNYGNADGQVDADETITLAVSVRSTRSEPTGKVSAILTTADPSVTIHNSVALYPDIAAGGLEESLPPHFTLTTGPDCGAHIPFTLETRYESGLSTLSHFSVAVGTEQPGTLLADDMETDIGWSVTGDATDGAWQWGDPVGNDILGDPTNPEDDHTPDPGANCWATANAPEGIIVPPNAAEVDAGTTELTSPVLAAAAYESLELTFWRWFFTGDGPGPDTFRAQATSDGVNWRTLHEVSSKVNQWVEVRTELSDAIMLTDDLQVRFTVTDAGGESIVEGGLDDLDLSGIMRVCDPFDPPLLDPPNPVGNTLTADRLGWDVRLDWQAPPTGAGHGPATFYRVHRSEQADAGFGEVANPTAPTHVDAGSAGPSAPDLYFFLVSAENSGGGE